MSNSTIRDLYYGNNTQIETIKPTNEYWKISEKLNKKETEFENTLNDKQKKLYNEVIDLIYEQSGESSEYHFVEGFKLGLNLGVECSQNNNE